MAYRGTSIIDMASLCFDVEHVLGMNRDRGGSPMVTADGPTRIKSILFAVIEAIQGKLSPTLHQQAVGSLICPYLINPCCMKRQV